MTNIEIDGVDLPMLNKQRRELHDLLVKNPDTFANGKERGDLWGLLGLLDHICDKYETLAYDPDKCEHAYSTDGEQSMCMFCGKDELDN